MNQSDQITQCLEVLQNMTEEEIVRAVGQNLPAAIAMREIILGTAPLMGWGSKREVGLYLLTVGAACFLGDQREQQAQSEFRVDTNPLEALMRKPRG